MELLGKKKKELAAFSIILISVIAASPVISLDSVAFTCQACRSQMPDAGWVTLGAEAGRGTGHYLRRYVPFGAGTAPEPTQYHLEFPAFNSNRFAIEQSIGHFLPAGGEYSLKGRAGNIHVFGSRLLVQSLQVFKAYGLGFSQIKRHLFKFMQRHAGRFEVVYLREKGNPTAL
jgi:hypothetical protein